MGEQIENINYLAPTGFKITISREFYPHLQYFAQSVSHPNMDVQATETPFKRIDNIPLIGDKISVGALTLDLIMDENMKSYEEIYNWMKRMVEEEHNTSGGRFLNAAGPTPSYCDIRVMVLTSHNNSNRELVYRNALPVSLGNIEFNSTSDGTYVVFPVTFRFDYFEIK